jgi:hypothetical protein
LAFNDSKTLEITKDRADRAAASARAQFQVSFGDRYPFGGVAVLELLAHHKDEGLDPVATSRVEVLIPRPVRLNGR